MATVAHQVTTPSTANSTSYPTSNFTPAAGDLLVALVTATGTVDPGTLTNSEGLTFTKITTAVKTSGADTLYLFVADQLAASVSQTCTFNCAGDAATGAIVSILSVSGMTRTGSGAVRQSAVKNNGSTAGTPAVSFGSAALTGNLLIGFVGNASTPATLTPPAGWSELFDSTGYISPTTGQEVAAIASGFVSSTVTWGSTSATSFAAIAAEFDTSLTARTGTLAASESDPDTCSASGTAATSGTNGTLAASESGLDTCSASGDVFVKGSISASESGLDTCSASGDVFVKGSISASESGLDTCSISGGVFDIGRLPTVGIFTIKVGKLSLLAEKQTRMATLSDTIHKLATLAAKVTNYG